MQNMQNIQNILAKTSIKKAIFALTALMIGGLAMNNPDPAQAVEIWSDDKNKAEIKGDFHYGLFHSGVSFDPDDAPNYDPVSSKAKGEIDFKYKGKINSDLDFGFKVEAKIGAYDEEEKTSLFKLDENYIYLKSPSFGEIALGSDKGAAGDHHVRAPEFLAKDLNAIEGQDFKPLNKLGDHDDHFDVKDETDIDYDEDVHKLIYYTPRIGGFEFGISYTPNLHPRASGENNKGLASNDDDIKNGVALHAHYEGDLGGMEIAASLGYLTATRNGEPDPSAWNVGAQLGMKIGAGIFKIGGGYLMAEDFKDEESVLIAGAAYEWDQWKAGIHYRIAEQEIAEQEGDEEKTVEKTVNEIEIGGSYRFNRFFAVSAMAEYGMSEIIDTNDGSKSEAEGYSAGTILTINF